MWSSKDPLTYEDQRHLYLEIATGHRSLEAVKDKQLQTNPSEEGEGEDDFDKHELEMENESILNLKYAGNNSTSTLENLSVGEQGCSKLEIVAKKTLQQLSPNYSKKEESSLDRVLCPKNVLHWTGEEERTLMSSEYSENETTHEANKRRQESESQVQLDLQCDEVEWLASGLDDRRNGQNGLMQIQEVENVPNSQNINTNVFGSFSNKSPPLSEADPVDIANREFDFVSSRIKQALRENPKILLKPFQTFVEKGKQGLDSATSLVSLLLGESGTRRALQKPSISNPIEICYAKSNCDVRSTRNLRTQIKRRHAEDTLTFAPAKRKPTEAQLS